jgi:glycosyltransferase involved in cell wall biosynthesis
MDRRRKRILVVGPVPPPFHGVATFTRDLLEFGRHPDFELLHLDTSDRRDAENIGKWDVQNVQLGFSHVAQLAASNLKSSVDFVYVPISQNVPAFLRDTLFILQSRMMLKKVVLHLHGGYFREFYQSAPAQQAGQSLIRSVMNSAAAVVVLAQEFKPILKGIVPEEKIFVVENGVPDLATASSTGSTSQKTLLYMSTLTRTKGILELLNALSLVLKTRRDIHLKIAGNFSEDDLKTEAVALVEREQLQSHVQWVGNVSGSGKAEFLNSGDIFCLPTRYPYEGQPLAILEAMAAGLPILSTAHGAIASTVADCGKTIPKGASPQVLADAIEQMLSNSAELAACGVRARKRYEERYTVQACHARLFKVFQSI